MDCSENQLAYSSKWKLKRTRQKAIFSKIHLPGQVLMSDPGYTSTFILWSRSSFDINSRHEYVTKSSYYRWRPSSGSFWQRKCCRNNNVTGDHPCINGHQMLKSSSSNCRLDLWYFWQHLLNQQWFYKNISRRVVDNVLINISLLNIFLTILFPARVHQNCQTVFSHRGSSLY